MGVVVESLTLEAQEKARGWDLKCVQEEPRAVWTQAGQGRPPSVLLLGAFMRH